MTRRTEEVSGTFLLITGVPLLVGTLGLLAGAVPFPCVPFALGVPVALGCVVHAALGRPEARRWGTGRATFVLVTTLAVLLTLGLTLATRWHG